MGDLEERQRLHLVPGVAQHGGEGRVDSMMRPSSPTTTTPIAEFSMARRKRCSPSAMRRRSTRVCSMISAPSNGRDDDADRKLEAEGKAAVRRIEARQRAGDHQADKRRTDRAARNRHVERRQEGGSEHQRHDHQEQRELGPAGRRQGKQRAGADGRGQLRQPPRADSPASETRNSIISTGNSTRSRAPRRPPSARTSDRLPIEPLRHCRGEQAAANNGATMPPISSMIE